MLLVGLLVTMGIGSSFSTVPILAAIFVPLCVQLGFSPIAIVCIVGTAGALGDAGSPASDSTLGPTSGLNIDGQHHHIWDTVVPTFLHYNLPLLAMAISNTPSPASRTPTVLRWRAVKAFNHANKTKRVNRHAHEPEG